MKKIDKIIFLDVDGVINSDDWAEWCYHNISFIKDGGCNLISPNLVKKVIKICESTNAKIVLSSSWRHWSLGQTLKQLASKRDLRPILDNLVGVTPRSDERHRGKEIDYFLNCCKKEYMYTADGDQLSDERYKFVRHPKYVIIDDDDDMLDEQMPYFVQTDFMVGITDEDVKKSIKILNGSK
jgi:hypothetical protein